MIRQTLDAAKDHDMLPVSAELTTLLLNYKPLLQEFQYEAWTIAPRERLLDLYVKGCLYVAQARLNLNLDHHHNLISIELYSRHLFTSAVLAAFLNCYERNVA